MKPFLQSVGILVWVILSTGRSQAGVRLLTGDANGAFFDQDTRIFDLSGDGNRVLFLAEPADSGDTPGIPARGLYVRDIAAGTLRLLVGEPFAEGDATPIVAASMSDDARWVAWQTSALNVYWHDASTDETRLLNPGSPGTSSRPIMSADGHRVAFCSLARNLVADVSLLPAVGRAAVLLYDSVANTTTVASLTHDGKGLLTGLPGPDPSLEFDFSADGKWVVFSTDDLDVHPERLLLPVPNLTWVYRRQVETGQVDPVVRDAAGLVPLGIFTLPRCNGNASRVLFAGTALGIGGDGGLVDGYTFPGGTDLYAKDIPAGMVWRVTLTVDGSPGNAPYPARPWPSAGTAGWRCSGPREPTTSRSPPIC